MKSRVVKVFILVLFICFIVSGITLYYLFQNDLIIKDIKIALIDETNPTIKLKQDKIYIDENTSYNVYDNVTYSFGKLGGIIKCDEPTLKIGRNDITCSAIGNNGLKASKIFSIYKSPTYQKTAIFFGDSITAGFGSNFNFSWANLLKENYDFKDCVNAGINDFRVSTYQRPNKWLGNAVLEHYEDQENYDYVILQGGINDALINAPLGELSTTYDEELDISTFYGGLEEYIKNVINKWPNSKIGYIITYYIPNYDDYIYSYEHFKEYYEAIKRVLVKYDIPYLDLFEGNDGIEKYSKILEIDTTNFLEDNLHLNDDGYKEITPYIYEWMQNLKQYKK